MNSPSIRQLSFVIVHADPQTGKAQEVIDEIFFFPEVWAAPQ